MFRIEKVCVIKSHICVSDPDFSLELQIYTYDSLFVISTWVSNENLKFCEHNTEPQNVLPCQYRSPGSPSSHSAPCSLFSLIMPSLLLAYQGACHHEALPCLFSLPQVLFFPEGSSGSNSQLLQAMLRCHSVADHTDNICHPSHPALPASFTLFPFFPTVFIAM